MRRKIFNPQAVAQGGARHAADCAHRGAKGRERRLRPLTTGRSEPEFPPYGKQPADCAGLVEVLWSPQAGPGVAPQMGPPGSTWGGGLTVVGVFLA